MSVSHLLTLLQNHRVETHFGRLGHSLRFPSVKQLTTDPEKWGTLVSLLPNLSSVDIYGVTVLESRGPDSDHPLSFDFTDHLASHGDATEEFFSFYYRSQPSP